MRRKSLKQLSGYSNAKRQQTRKMGGAAGRDALMVIGVVVIILLILAVRVIDENPLIFGVIGVVALAVGVVWLGFVKPKQDRERLTEEERVAAEEERELAEAKRQRREKLISKYGDEEIVSKIIGGTIWYDDGEDEEGEIAPMTAEMVVDM